MNKRYYEHTLPIIRGSLSNTYFLLLYGYIYHAAFQQKRIRKALFLCGKKRVRLRQKRMEEAGIFYVELLW